MARVDVIFLLSLCLLTLSGFANAGAVCLPSCIAACCAWTGGPAAFAGAIGIAIDYTGCWGVCLAACACSAWAPPACFADDTIITVSSPDGALHQRPIHAVNADDMVLTLVDGQPSLTRVVRNTKSSGRFPFFEFQVESNNTKTISSIKVTPQHGMLLIDEVGEMRFSFPSDVRIGDKMKSSDGSAWIVSGIDLLEGEEKFTLETSEGSVLASGLLVSTICSEEISTGAIMKPVISAWKLKHYCHIHDKTQPICRNLDILTGLPKGLWTVSPNVPAYLMSN